MRVEGGIAEIVHEIYSVYQQVCNLHTRTKHLQQILGSISALGVSPIN